MARFPRLVARLRGMVERFLTTLSCVDQARVAADALKQVATPGMVGQTRVGGLDLNKPRLRAVLAAVLALAPAPRGVTAGQVAAQVQARLGPDASVYHPPQAAYDLKKLRAKGLLSKARSARRYQVPPEGWRTIAALVILREHVLNPLLAGTAQPKMGRRPKTWRPIDTHYQAICRDMPVLFADLGLAA